MRANVVSICGRKRKKNPIEEDVLTDFKGLNEASLSSTETKTQRQKSLDPERVTVLS